MSDPYDSAIVGVGRFLLPIGLLLWGMASAQSRARRPGANAAALRGLMFSLGAWVMLLLNGAFASMLPWQVAIVGILAVVTLGIWAFALGVIGLLKVRSVRTGLVPGIFALVIGGGLSAVMAWESWSGYAGGRAQAAQPSTPAHLDEFGLSITPPVGWSAIDPKLIPNARLAYVRPDPDMSLVVMADHAPQGQTFSDSGMLSYVRSSLGVPDASAIAEEPYSVSGREGFKLTVNSAGRDGKFNYTIWLSTSPSEAILVMVSAKAADVGPLVVASEADRIFKTLTLK